ncbi:hypothetical protein TrLO_g2589, partial [Triparma laevis f. longispina]
HFKLNSGTACGGGVFRLEFSPDFDETVLSKSNVTNTSSTPLEVLNSLSYGFCSNSLFANSIKKTAPLPSYYWDEVSDYLSCHTEATVDFNSSDVKASPGAVYEDDRCFLCSSSDLGDNAECLNGVEGYEAEEEVEGEEAIEEMFKWVDECCLPGGGKLGGGGLENENKGSKVKMYLSDEEYR